VTSRLHESHDGSASQQCSPPCTWGGGATLTRLGLREQQLENIHLLAVAGSAVWAGLRPDAGPSPRDPLLGSNQANHLRNAKRHANHPPRVWPSLKTHIPRVQVSGLQPLDSLVGFSCFWEMGYNGPLLAASLPSSRTNASRRLINPVSRKSWIYSWRACILQYVIVLVQNLDFLVLMVS
jgi:hypothetical protein